MSRDSLTQERLKELMHYDPDTGVFTRRIDVGVSYKRGMVAGSCDAINRYVRIMIDKRSYMAHRLAFLYMTGVFPRAHVDHANHVRNDNRWSNINNASQHDNNRNTTLQKNNSSGVLGVSWFKPRNKWRSRVMVDYKEVHLGYYDEFDDAVAARNRANEKYGFHENHGK